MAWVDAVGRQLASAGRRVLGPPGQPTAGLVAWRHVALDVPSWTERTRTMRRRPHVERRVQQMSSSAPSHLDRLEAESIHILREVVAGFQNPVMMYSVGKDSSVLLDRTSPRLNSSHSC